jgi:hypothetical protein
LDVEEFSDPEIVIAQLASLNIPPPDLHRDPLTGRWMIVGTAPYSSSMSRNRFEAPASFSAPLASSTTETQRLSVAESRYRWL